MTTRTNQKITKSTNPTPTLNVNRKANSNVYTNAKAIETNSSSVPFKTAFETKSSFVTTPSTTSEAMSTSPNHVTSAKSADSKIRIRTENQTTTSTMTTTMTMPIRTSVNPTPTLNTNDIPTERKQLSSKT